jgi:hypothetical protein
VLGLGFNPNRHITEKKEESKKWPTDSVLVQHKEELSGTNAYFIAGARVIAHAGMTQEQEKKKKWCQIQTRGGEHDPAWRHQH